MGSTEPERSDVDAVIDDALGHLLPHVVTPYLVAYFGSVLVMSGSLGSIGGLFIVVLAVLLILSLTPPFRRWQPTSRKVRVTIGGACALLGILVAALVENHGLS